MMNSYGNDVLEMEFQIWTYLDGDCIEDEKKRIEYLIATDEHWEAMYNELRGLHNGLSTSIEMEHPSMRFSQNIMEAVASEKVSRPIKSYVNQWVIRGLTAFFILVIGYNFFPLFSKINIEFNTGDSALLHVNQSLWQPSIYVFLFMTAIVFVLLIDALIQRRKSTATRNSKSY